MSTCESILNQFCHRNFNEICTKMYTKMNTARERGYRFRLGINTICTNCTCWGSVEKLIQLSSQKTTILPPQNPSKVDTKTRPKGHRNLNEISNNLKAFWGAKLWPCWADVVSQDGIKFIKKHYPNSVENKGGCSPHGGEKKIRMPPGPGAPYIY